ncbi:MAG: DRTGG domain-containing protein [Clostridia bacterium]|jgi:serine kinase of HPr protein (carbohydrate metabolism regulator)|nr:DRTGG domain-containing protein [Clostridia bacterium]
MTIRDIANLLEANVHAFDEKQLDKEIETAFGSDMMSDVLAYADEGSVLLSGLLNPQVIRTAHMLDMPCIVFVRGKSATPEILSLAEESHIVVLETALRMYGACGRLYCAGLDNR